MRDPRTGIGKPEPLKYLGAGMWSRRLTEEHRLVYRVTAERMGLLQGRYHYWLPGRGYWRGSSAMRRASCSGISTGTTTPETARRGCRSSVAAHSVRRASRQTVGSMCGPKLGKNCAS